MKLPVKGKRVELRERTGEDLRRELEWKKDPEICYLEGLLHKDEELPDCDFDRWEKVSSENIEGNLVLSIYIAGKHVGTIGFFPDSPLTGEAGMLIGEKEWRGRGYGTEALGLFTEYLFREMALEKIHASVQVFNKSALGVALNAGFLEKERIKRHSLKYGVYEEIYLEIEKK